MSTLASPSCASGGTFFSCSSGSGFVGCCAQGEACGSGCSPMNFRAASFTPSSLSQFPGQSCGQGSRLYAAANSFTSFIGCCRSNPFTAGGCPQSDVVPGLFNSLDNTQYVIDGNGNTVNARIPGQPNSLGLQSTFNSFAGTSTLMTAVSSMQSPYGSPALPASFGASSPVASLATPQASFATIMTSPAQSSFSATPSQSSSFTTTTPSATPTETSDPFPDIPPLPHNTVLGLAIGLSLGLAMLLSLFMLCARRHSARSRERHGLTRPMGEAFLDAPSAYKSMGKIAPGHSATFEPPTTYSDSSFFRSNLRTPPPVYSSRFTKFIARGKTNVSSGSHTTTASRYSYHSAREFVAERSRSSSLQHTPQELSPLAQAVVREEQASHYPATAKDAPTKDAPKREDVGWPLVSDTPNKFMNYF